MAFPASGLYARVRTLLPELIKFCVIGGIGTVIDLGGAGLLHSKYQVEPLAAKAVSVTIATIFTYLGSRFWTFKHRENQSMQREAVLFFVLNVIGLLIAEAVIGLVTYVFGLRGAIPYNAASVIGTGLGTIFRFYAYRKWVFLDPAQQQPAPTAQPTAQALPDYPAWELEPPFLAPANAPAAYAWEPAGAPAWEPSAALSRNQPAVPSAWGAPLAAPAAQAAHAPAAPFAPAAPVAPAVAPAARQAVPFAPTMPLAPQAPAVPRPPASSRPATTSRPAGRHRKS